MGIAGGPNRHDALDAPISDTQHYLGYPPAVPIAAVLVQPVPSSCCAACPAPATHVLRVWGGPGDLAGEPRSHVGPLPVGSSGPLPHRPASSSALADGWRGLFLW